MLEETLEQWLWQTLPEHPAWGTGRWSDGIEVLSVEADQHVEVTATLHGLRTQQRHPLAVSLWWGEDDMPRYAVILRGYGQFRLD